MSGKVWVLSPHKGGRAIPSDIRDRIRKRILAHAAKPHRNKFARVEVSFRGKFCYLDAFEEPLPPSKGLLAALGETKAQYLSRLRLTPIHLCRLRYFMEDRWSLGIYTYSHERYETAVFPDGNFVGKPEAAFDLCAGMYG